MTTFYNSVTNVGFIDNSWCGILEATANLCFAPRRWLLSDCGSTCNASKEHYVTLIDNELQYKTRDTDKSEGIRKIIRITVSLFAIIPAEILGNSLMKTAAFLSKEIRWKHAFTENKLSAEEQTMLKHMIEERQKLADQRQGCDPTYCSLITIICLLFCILNKP